MTRQIPSPRHGLLCCMGRIAAVWLSAGPLLLAVGCATAGHRVDIVRYPPPPAATRVVHLQAFNRLDELVPKRTSWVDVIRGRVASPFVGTPGGVAYRDGHLYVCDTAIDAVHDWNLATGEATRIGRSGEIVLAKPVAVAVDAGGTVYVADTGRSEVVAFDRSGRAMGRYRPADRERYQPVAVAVADAKLYVANLSAHEIDVFSTAGAEHLGSLGGVGSEIGKLYYPTGVAIDADGRVLVSDMMNGRVQRFDSQGAPLLSMGQPGNRYGDLGKPRHLAVGDDGTIFIADSEFARIHMFNQAGQLLMLLGSEADRPGGTPLPVGVCVAHVLPDRLEAEAPADFSTAYFLFTANSVGTKRISLWAVGRQR